MLNLMATAWECREYLEMVFILAIIGTYLSFFMAWAIRLVLLYDREAREDKGLIRCLKLFLRTCLKKTLRLTLAVTLMVVTFNQAVLVTSQITRVGAILVLFVGALVIQRFCYKVLDELRGLLAELISLIKCVKLGLFVPKAAKDKTA